MTEPERDWIAELVDWQMRGAPSRWRTCRACWQGYHSTDSTCPDCGVRQAGG